MKKVAVVTDALSQDYFLPIWVDYYGRHFGRQNLFVVSYREKFEPNKLGVGHLLLSSSAYDENLRIRLFNQLSEKLLADFDCVIRTDVDEFLAPDPRRHASLRAYVDAMEGDHVTALGLDVVQMPSEAELNYQVSPMLQQRRFAVKVSAYSKTCVTNRPIKWGLGFHTANVRPVFDDLYLFHMKFADPYRRLAWFDHMAERCRSDESHFAHFTRAKKEFETTLAMFQGLERWEGEAAISDRAFIDRMERALVRTDDGDFHFVGIPTTDRVLCEIPRSFQKVF